MKEIVISEKPNRPIRYAVALYMNLIEDSCIYQLENGDILAMIRNSSSFHYELGDRAELNCFPLVGVEL